MSDRADALDVASLGTSPAALARHYDVSNEFFALWLGPEMVYSCALWDPADGSDDLARAQDRKVDHFASALGVEGGRVLDVGCGWGGVAARLIRHHHAAEVVGLTPSRAQVEQASGRERAGSHVPARGLGRPRAGGAL